jgi:hypothetical protein
MLENVKPEKLKARKINLELNLEFLSIFWNNEQKPSFKEV